MFSSKISRASQDEEDDILKLNLFNKKEKVEMDDIVKKYVGLIQNIETSKKLPPEISFSVLLSIEEGKENFINFINHQTSFTDELEFYLEIDGQMLFEKEIRKLMMNEKYMKLFKNLKEEEEEDVESKFKKLKLKLKKELKMKFKDEYLKSIEFKDFMNDYNIKMMNQNQYKIEKDILIFKELFNSNEEEIKLFKSFTISEYCSENFKFLQVLQIYKRNLNKKEKLNLMKEIYNEFVSTTTTNIYIDDKSNEDVNGNSSYNNNNYNDNDLNLNISEIILNEMNELFKIKHFKIFNKIEIEIIKIIRELYQRFILTKEWMDYLNFKKTLNFNQNFEILSSSLSIDCLDKDMDDLYKKYNLFKIKNKETLFISNAIIKEIKIKEYDYVSYI